MDGIRTYGDSVSVSMSCIAELQMDTKRVVVVKKKKPPTNCLKHEQGHF
jgi:hypothetical protein